jgi:hypothetical protein
VTGLIDQRLTHIETNGANWHDSPWEIPPIMLAQPANGNPTGFRPIFNNIPNVHISGQVPTQQPEGASHAHRLSAVPSRKDRFDGSPENPSNGRP